MSCSRAHGDDDQAKWICKACTYENWPRATKCTLCSQLKNSTLIIGGEPGHKSEKDHEREERRQRERQRDIYKMASLIIEKKESNHHHQDANSNQPTNLKNSNFTDNPNNKWQCPRCTYLNWPNSSKCTQCSTLRKRSPTASASDLHTMSRGDSPQHADKLSSLAQARAEMHSPLLQSSNEKWWAELHKWPCLVCTYENWPKNNKCVLCYTSRGSTTLPYKSYYHVHSSSSSTSSVQKTNTPASAAALLRKESPSHAVGNVSSEGGSPSPGAATTFRSPSDPGETSNAMASMENEVDVVGERRQSL